MKQLPFQRDDKKQVTFYMSRKTFLRFKEKFPNVTTFFLTRCIERAIQDEVFFNTVFFKEDK